MLQYVVSIKKRTLVIGSQCVNKRVLRFCISLREVFSNWTSFKVINQYGKVPSFRLQQCFGPFTMLLVEGSSEKDFLDIYLTAFFGVRKFKNASAMTELFFWKIFKIWPNSKNEKKNREKLFLSETIVSKDVAINRPF